MRLEAKKLNWIMSPIAASRQSGLMQPLLRLPQKVIKENFLLLPNVLVPLGQFCRSGRGIIVGYECISDEVDSIKLSNRTNLRTKDVAQP